MISEFHLTHLGILFDWTVGRVMLLMRHRAVRMKRQEERAKLAAPSTGGPGGDPFGGGLPGFMVG